MNGDKLLSIREVAAKINRSPQFVEDILSGRIVDSVFPKPLYSGKRRLWLAESVNQYLKLKKSAL